MGRPSESEFAWLMLTGILIMFLLALSVVLFFVFYQRRLFAQQSAMERLKLDEQKKRLENEINIQEIERERIARDLHDEVGALLSTLKLYLTFEPVKQEQPDHVKIKSTELIDEAIGKLRSISKNLMPENLKLSGLIKTISRQAQQIDESGAIRVIFEHKLHVQLNPETEKHLFRIVQEMLNNALRHAPKSEVKIQLMQSGNDILLAYADNGPGLTKTDNHPEAGIGLISMRNRAQILNGEMDLVSQPGRGLRITIRFPIIV